MSDKLTKEMLDALIQEAMLQEKYTFDGTGDEILADLGITGNSAKPLKPTRTKVAPLKKVTAPLDKFTADDVATAIAKGTPKLKKAAAIINKKATNQEFRNDISAALSASGGLTQKPETAADATAGAGAQGIDIESFTFPRPLGDLTSATKGKFLGSQNQLINSVFDQADIRARLKKVSDISDALSAPPASMANLGSRELLQYTMVADLFDLFFNQIDQRAGGYMFETFLANLAGGTVEGGSNGIADFKTGGGQDGSAKLYQTWSLITQSHKGLTQPGQSIHYVIGIHGKKQEETRTKIDLYYVVTTLEKINSDGSKEIIYSDGDGDIKNVATFGKDAKMDISSFTNPDDYYVGSFEMTKAGKNYKERLNDVVSDTGIQTDSKKALESLKKFFNNLYQAEENTKKYTAQKDSTNVATADKALEQYDQADQNLQDLLILLSPGKRISGTKGARKLAENKMTELDLMVENMVKQFIKGKLND